MMGVDSHTMWFVLLLCAIAAFADVIGGAMTVIKRLNEREMLIVAGLGAGFLLGATLLDRLPDSMSELPTMAPLYMIIGYLALLLMEQYGTHSHNVGKMYVGRTDTLSLPSHAHTMHEHTILEHSMHEHTIHHQSIMSSKSALASFLGLLLHTFMDGVIIAGAFSINRATGVLIFFAITMHKIPEGFSMATITLASGASRRHALITSSALAVSTLIGAVLTLEAGFVDENVVKVLMALATGTFLFVSTTDMIPALKAQRSSSMLSIVAGVFIFYVSLLLIKHVGLS